MSESKDTQKINQIAFLGNLLNFQSEVFEWSEKTCKGILGLDMGLGKTIITIKIICSREYEKIIIIVPTSLIDQWVSEFVKFTDINPMNIIKYVGQDRDRLDMENAKIVISNYDTIRIDMEKTSSKLYLNRKRFDCMVLDEAHKIRNGKTKTYQCCYNLGQNCRSKWLLSGTIINNGFQDFICLAHFLQVKNLDADQFTNPAKISQWKSKYYYRLTKEDADLSLPGKVINDHYLEYDVNHKKIYDGLVKDTVEIYSRYLGNHSNWNSLLTKILRLRQCCNHPYAMSHENIEKDLLDNMGCKFRKIVEIIRNSPQNDQILIFSQWDHSLSLLEQYLDRENIEYLYYNGRQTSVQKNQTIVAFQKFQIKTLLLTLGSGGVGLNLTNANHVIIMDSWWNPALEEQAYNRAYRIGQNKLVHVHKLYVKNTIEEWMIEMKKQKIIADQKFHEENSHYAIDRAILKNLLHMHTTAELEEN